MDKEIISYCAFIPPAFILLFIISYVIYAIWYKINYVDKKGWHKCRGCKKVESEIYYTSGLFGRIYRCLECSKKNNDDKTS